jgi:peptidoglycan biosynthesis protein MviN/MurJ (putative lipid II flippase)
MSQAAMSHTAYYLRWVVWMLPLTALAGVTTAYLQSQERFLLPALGTLLFNSCLIVGLIITSSQNLLASLALCILIGASLRWLSQLLSLRQPSSYFISWDAWLIDHKLLVRYFQAVLAGGVLVYLPVIANAYASLTGAGGLATMNYANKLVQLPMGVALGAAAIVLLPKFSELLQSEQPTQVQQGISLLQQSSMFMLILSFALCLSLCLFASPVTSLIFHRGQINNQNIVDISKLAMIGFLSLPAQALISLLVAAFNAQRNTATPFWVSCIGLLVFFPVATILHHKFALQGVVISIVAVYWLIMILQVVYLWRKQHITIFNRHSVPVILRCFVTQCLIMSFIAWINFNTPPNVWYNIALFCITMLLLSAAGLLQVAPFRQNLLSKIRMEIP